MIEHTTDLRWRYQISAQDPRVVERKPNKPYARWTFWLRRDTPGEATAALLKIESDQEGAATP